MQFADMHCDTIGRIYGAQKEGKTVSLRRNTYHLDLEKMKKANYLLQHFALFLSLEETEDAVKEGLDMLRCYKEQLAENSDLILPARNLQDILDNQKNGKMSAILTLEEGDITGGRPDALPKYAEEGVRMITLTWNHKNSLGSPNLTHDAQGNALISARCSEGLTENGIDFIQEMERLGILIDVSHLSDGGFWDVIHYTKKPFVASHSNAAALCPFCRNMTDDMIRALAERGGVMGLNFCGDFLTFPSPENPSLITAGYLPWWNISATSFMWAVWKLSGWVQTLTVSVPVWKSRMLLICLCWLMRWKKLDFLRMRWNIFSIRMCFACMHKYSQPTL